MGSFNEKQDGLASEIHTNETSRPSSHVDEGSSTPSKNIDIEKGSQSQSTR
jgi:hypothetical protein